MGFITKFLLFQKRHGEIVVEVADLSNPWEGNPQAFFCLGAQGLAPAPCQNREGRASVTQSGRAKCRGGQVRGWGLCYSNAGIAISCSSYPAVTLIPWGDRGGEGKSWEGAKIPHEQECNIKRAGRCHLIGLTCQIQFPIKVGPWVMQLRVNKFSISFEIRENGKF